jgi:hypothetical protein
MNKMYLLSLSLLTSGLFAQDVVSEQITEEQQEQKSYIVYTQEDVPALAQNQGLLVALPCPRAEGVTDEQWEKVVRMVYSMIRYESDITFASVVKYIDEFTQLVGYSPDVTTVALSLEQGAVDKDDPLKHSEESDIDFVAAGRGDGVQVVVKVNKGVDYTEQAWEELVSRIIDFDTRCRQNDENSDLSSRAFFALLADVPTCSTAQA